MLSDRCGKQGRESVPSEALNLCCLAEARQRSYTSVTAGITKGVILRSNCNYALTTNGKVVFGRLRGLRINRGIVKRESIIIFLTGGRKRCLMYSIICIIFGALLLQ